jgi:GT2 family glycosyltransferase
MKTVKDIFSKATHPDRIFVGIVEQNSADRTEECVPTGFKHHDNVRRLTIPNGEAKGPCYARYLCSTLFRDESYFMQIDSHSTFVDGWDVKAIDALKQCPSSKSILSGYPHDDSAYDITATAVPVLCDSTWNDDGLPQLKAVVKSQKDIGTSPHPIPFTSGGFIFAPGSLVRDVPYDPSLHHLFQGEEILYTVRAWTSGYDIFTSPVNIVLHKYTRHDEPKFWNDIPNWRADQQKAAKRVRRILGLEKPVIPPGQDPYGLGSARTVQQYWEFSGLDPNTKTSRSKEKFCDVRVQ